MLEHIGHLEHFDRLSESAFPSHGNSFFIKGFGSADRLYSREILGWMGMPRLRRVGLQRSAIDFSGIFRSVGQGAQVFERRKWKNPSFTAIERGLSDELRGNDPRLFGIPVGQRDIADLIDKTGVASRQTMHQGTGFICKQRVVPSGNLQPVANAKRRLLFRKSL